MVHSDPMRSETKWRLIEQKNELVNEQGGGKKKKKVTGKRSDHEWLKKYVTQADTRMNRMYVNDSV